MGTKITLTNIGDYVQFHDLNPSNYSSDAFRYFAMTGRIAASGNIQSMLNYSDECTKYCYYRMFDGCTSLTTAPVLPATTLANYCYNCMFRSCSRLTVAPELPAKTLASGCYDSMFKSCTSLTAAPELPAKTFAYWCYPYMFQGCSNLSYIKVGFTGWSYDSYRTDWVAGVSSTGTFEAPAELPVQFGTSKIPVGWTVTYGKYIKANNQSLTGKINEEVNYQIDYEIYPEDLQPTFNIIEGELPAGLILDTYNGIITGIQTEVFNGNVKIQIYVDGLQPVDIVISIIILEVNQIISDGLQFYQSFSKNAVTPEIGNQMTVITEAPEIKTINNIQCAEFTLDSHLYDDTSVYYDINVGKSPTFTISYWINFLDKGYLNLSLTDFAGFVQIGQGFGNINTGSSILHGVSRDNKNVVQFSGHDAYREFNSLCNTNTWYFMTLTMQNSSLNIYMDGNKLRTISRTSYNMCKTNFIGFNVNKVDGAWNTNPLNFALADVRLYNRILTTTEIQELYAEHSN